MQLYAHPNTNVLYLRKRQGFIKLAMETGAQLVPVFSFGETDTFRQMSTDYAVCASLPLWRRLISLTMSNVAAGCALGQANFPIPQRVLTYSPATTFVLTLALVLCHRFSLPLISNIIPLPCNVTTVVGRPIPVERVEKPTDQEVCAFVRSLFLPN
jgi:hypothetical protein